MGSHRTCLCFVLALSLLSVGSAMAQTDSSTRGQDQKTTGATEAQPDPGLQFLGNVLRAIEAKRREDARRKAEEDKRNADAAAADAASTDTTTRDAAADKDAAVAASPAVPADMPPPRTAPVARAIPRPVSRPAPPRPVVTPEPVTTPAPGALVDTAPVLPPPPRSHPAPLTPTPAVVASMPDTGSGLLFILLAVLVAAAGAASYAARYRLGFVVLPLPNAKAHADAGSVSQPHFANDVEPPPIAFLISSRAFTTDLEYPDAAQ